MRFYCKVVYLLSGEVEFLTFAKKVDAEIAARRLQSMFVSTSVGYICR